MDKTYKRTVLDSNGMERIEVISQQKLASQKPRGTRINKTGTQLEIKGARNYTSQPLQVGPHEIYDDIVERGLRADGLSTKLGVRNNKDSIARLVQTLLDGDSRLAETMQHYRTKRQRNNCAKNIFATMTDEELKIIKGEMFPTRIDVQIRNCLREIYSEQSEKIHNTIEVLKNVQNTFKHLAPHAELLSTHNFQTRGFFVDVLVMMSSFIIQIIEDVNGFGEQSEVVEAVNGIQQDYNDNKQDTTAAEILLSVGSDIQRMEMTPIPNTFDSNNQSTENLDSSIKENTLFGDGNKDLSDTIISTDSKGAECKQWTTVEMTDNNGQKKYFLVRNPAVGNMDTNKFLEILHSETGVNIETNSEQPCQFINSENIIQEGETESYNEDTNSPDIATFGKLNSNLSALPTIPKGGDIILHSCNTTSINEDTAAELPDTSSNQLTVSITTDEPPSKKLK